MVPTADEGVESAFAGRYRLLSEVGRGGMAAVYLAEDLRHGRRVALKVLPPDAAAASGAARFLREIQLTAQLTHQHILPLLDSGESGGRLFYTMPFVEGESLRQRLVREPLLPVEATVAIVGAIAGALDYAHARGIVHRDIKPENVLLAADPNGGPPHPWLADFGIAREAAGGGRVTETGVAVGTPTYMSPEQAGGNARLDGRSDIYALGCVAYEMLAGTPPFTGPTGQAILARHAVDPVPPLRTVRATVPPAVEAAIERALAKVPADRFAAAHEFAQALTPESGIMRRRRRARVPARKAPVTAVLAALGAVVVTAGAMLYRGFAAPVVVPAASRIAVLPFHSPAGDTSLARLGKDLATTISASLEGVGGIETADRLAIATNTTERDDVSTADGAALARRLGAGSMVRGTLVGAADRVRLDLGIYAVDDFAPVAEGITVTAHRDSIGPLTDSASWGLLRRVWRRGEPPSPSLEAITTRSLPALRAFLDGERELSANRWEKAGLAFGSAVAADSSFWLARFRHALSEYWSGSAFEFDAAPLRNHLHLLPVRERLVIGAMIDSMALESRIERLRTVTQRFPNYWPGWFLHADMLYHYAPNVGHDWTEAVDAFQRVVALNPTLVPAWEHLFQQVNWGAHPHAPRALARLIELGWTGHQDQFFRLQSGAIAAGGTIPEDLGSLADSLAELMMTSPVTFFERGYGRPGLRLLLEGELPAAQLDLNERALRVATRGTARVKAALRASNAWSWAARGRWDSALTLIAEVAAEWRGPVGPQRYSAPQYPPIGGPALAIESYAMAVVAAWLGAASPEPVHRRRPAAAAAIAGLEDEESRRDARGRIAWLDGVLGYVRRSRSEIQAARADVRGSGYRQAARVDASLAAFQRALAGDRARAGRQLAALEMRCINSTQAHSFVSEAHSCNQFTPHIAIQRLAAAQWLQEAGEVEQAARLLRYQDAAIWGGWAWTFHAALAAPTHLMRARLEEERGDAERARKHYRQFLRLYDQPMPSVAHLVEEAKGALARLSPGGEAPAQR